MREVAESNTQPRGSCVGLRLVQHWEVGVEKSQETGGGEIHSNYEVREVYSSWAKYVGFLFKSRFTWRKVLAFP